MYATAQNTTIRVCPHCLTPVTTYTFAAKDGIVIETHTCITHGNVIASRSAVSNPIPQYGPRTGTHPLAIHTPNRDAELMRFAAKFSRPILPMPMECYA
jgi:hypothetical protein